MTGTSVPLDGDGRGWVGQFLVGSGGVEKFFGGEDLAAAGAAAAVADPVGEQVAVGGSGAARPSALRSPGIRRRRLRCGCVRRAGWAAWFG